MLLLLAASTFWGCIIPFGWFTPPALVAVEADFRRSVSPALPKATPSRQHYRLGAHPLQLASSLADRSFDLGVGYHFHPSTDDNRPLSGWYAEGTWFFFRHDLDKTQHSAVRLGLTGRLRTLHVDATERPNGYGGSLQVTAEFSSFVPTIDQSGCEFERKYGLCGAVGMRGETGIGVYVAANYDHLGTTPSYGASVGLQFRLPTTWGGGFLFGIFK